MYMSAELMAIVIASGTLLVTLGGTMLASVAWAVRRIDALEAKTAARFDQTETSTNARFDRMQAETNARFDQAHADTSAEFAKVHRKLDDLQRDMTDVKIAVARLEGPQQRLIVATR